MTPKNELTEKAASSGFIKVLKMTTGAVIAVSTLVGIGFAAGTYGARGVLADHTAIVALNKKWKEEQPPSAKLQLDWASMTTEAAKCNYVRAAQDMALTEAITQAQDGPQGEAAQLQEEVARLDGDNQKLVARNSELEPENARLVSENDNLENDLEAERKKYKGLESEMAKLVSEKGSLENDLEAERRKEEGKSAGRLASSADEVVVYQRSRFARFGRPRTEKVLYVGIPWKTNLDFLDRSVTFGVTEIKSHELPIAVGSKTHYYSANMMVFGKPVEAQLNDQFRAIVEGRGLLTTITKIEENEILDKVTISVRREDWDRVDAKEVKIVP